MNVGVKKFYAAYGMNLCDRFMQPVPREAFPHDPYPERYAVIKDYKLVFRSGLATIEPCDGSEVPVGVWAITKNKELDLDMREGYPSLYRKEYFDIDIPGYGTVNAMVYIMNGDDKISPPSTYYESIIREGYINWNLDISVLNRAVAEAERAKK